MKTIKTLNESEIPKYGNIALKAYMDSSSTDKREHFSSLIMQGFAANPSIDGHISSIAGNAVRWADALLKELDK